MRWTPRKRQNSKGGKVCLRFSVDTLAWVEADQGVAACIL